MAVTVRLFAALRDAAGMSQVDVPAGTVPAIVNDLCGRYGEPFATRVKVASGMLDGRRVSLDDPVAVADGSELALLPPFSGGASAAVSERRIHGVLLVGSLLVPALLMLGASSTRWSFALVVLVVAAGSVFDLHNGLAATGVRTVLPGAALLGLSPPLLLAATPGIGGAGIGGAVAVAVMVTFLLVFSSPRRHQAAEVVASTLLAGLVVASGASALLIAYDQLETGTVIGMLALIAAADVGVIIAARPTAPDRSARRLLAAVTAALPTAIVLYAVGATGEPTGVVIAGLAVAAVASAPLSARLRSLLRDSGAGRATPALLVGTADACLFAAPLAVLWALWFAA